MSAHADRTQETIDLLRELLRGYTMYAQSRRLDASDKTRAIITHNNARDLLDALTDGRARITVKAE